MKTDALIASLGHDLRPVRRGAVGLRLATGIIVGIAVAAFLLSLTFGFRPDLWLTMQGATFWMKWGYTASFAVTAIVLTARLARPDPGRVGGLWFLLLPVFAMTAIAVVDLARTPRGEWLAMWLGTTWMVCPWLVLALSVPIFVGLTWSFRRFAPTNLRAAGGAAGLASGGLAATVYCLHCPEVSALFVLTWYSLGILIAGLMGALVGPRFLRW
jgi:hypothetical protein